MKKKLKAFLDEYAESLGAFAAWHTYLYALRYVKEFHDQPLTKSEQEYLKNELINRFASLQKALTPPEDPCPTKNSSGSKPSKRRVKSSSR